VPLQKTGWLQRDVIRQLREKKAVDPLVKDIQGTIDELEEWYANSSPAE